MNSVSKKAVARAFVSALEKYPYTQLLGALAREIVQRRWTRQIDLIAHEIMHELYLQRQHLGATVVSAHSLPAHLTARLTTWLRQRTSARTVTLARQEDRALVGGAVITTPTEEIDLSVRSHLKRLYAQ